MTATRSGSVRGALRSALRDLYENSWRLVVLNVVLAALTLAAAIAASYAQPALLLIVALGPFAAAFMHCAVTLQQTDRLRIGEVLVGLRLHWRRGLALGTLVSAAAILGVVAVPFWAQRGGAALPLAVVAVYVAAMFALWQIHVWPLAVARGDDDLAAVFRHAATGLGRRPFATLSLAVMLLLVNLLGAIGVLPVLTFTLAFSALAAAHFVLPPAPEEVAP
jgi:hypothetical protein